MAKKIVKKIIYSFIISLIMLFNISSQEIKTKNLLLVKEIPVGQGDGELGYRTNSQIGGPVGIGIDNNFNLYISDQVNKKLVEYNNDFLNIKSFNQSFIFVTSLFEFNNNEIISRYNYAVNYLKFDLNGNLLINIDFSKYNIPIILLSQDSYFLYKNLFITYSRQGMNNTTRAGIVSIQNPSADNEQNKKNLRNTEETRKIIKSQYKELTLDNKYRLILNGKIITRIFSDYLNFWEEQHKNMSPPKCAISLEKISNYNNCLYLGKDKDDNQYWGNYYGHDYNVFVFNKDGWLLTAFAPENIKIKIHPAIHPMGDVYFLDFDGKSNYLYMVPRTWGYNKTTKGTCTENGISIRQRPSVKADILGKLNKDDEIEIIDKTDIKLQVEEAYNYWYKIKLADGTMGWIFGEYVKE